MEKKLFYPLAGILAILLLCNTSTAQDLGPVKLKKDTSDTKKRNSEFLSIDFTNDMWLLDNDRVSQRGWSPGISFALYKNIFFGQSNLSIAPGIGFCSHNVHSNSVLSVTPGTDSTQSYTSLEPLTTDYKKNKLSANYIEIPVELRYVTKHSKPFRINAGFKAGWLANIHSKTKDEFGKRKFYDFENVNEFRYGIYSRIGIGYFNLFGFYSLTSLLEDGRGEEIIPVSFGLSIIM